MSKLEGDFLQVSQWHLVAHTGRYMSAKQFLVQTGLLISFSPMQKKGTKLEEKWNVEMEVLSFSIHGYQSKNVCIILWHSSQDSRTLLSMQYNLRLWLAR